MNRFRLTLHPRSAFGTPLAGDTLFGQLCWALRHQLGNARLNTLLDGYTAGQPFAVVSDGLPKGFLPLPSLPSSFWAKTEVERKTLKKMRWLPLEETNSPLDQWQSLAYADSETVEAITGTIAALNTEQAQPHNSINRQTGTTGEGQFAPYSQAQFWFHPAMQFDLYIALDESRLALAELESALAYIGQTGFGRDASIGLGKFDLVGTAQAAPIGSNPSNKPNAWLTLGPCTPQGQGFCPKRSFYQPLTRFGRHGDIAVQSGNPFKRPILLARSGSVFWPENLDGAQHFIGQGLAGVSEAMPETVHQGYAPVFALTLPELSS
jgi:CRISPR-associated protein Csm4